MDQKELEAMRKHTANFDYDQLVAMMLELQSQHSQAKEQSSRAWDAVCMLARGIIPDRMEADNVANITVILPDGERKQLLLLDKVSVKTPPENKVALWEWLREHDAAELISETVNSSSLAGYVTEQMRQGEDYPRDICEISTYTTASLRKAS
jgi:hypothetical protein